MICLKKKAKSHNLISFPKCVWQCVWLENGFSSSSCNVCGLGMSTLQSKTSQIQAVNIQFELKHSNILMLIRTKYKHLIHICQLGSGEHKPLDSCHGLYHHTECNCFQSNQEQIIQANIRHSGCALVLASKEKLFAEKSEQYPFAFSPQSNQMSTNSIDIGNTGGPAVKNCACHM